jgi:hypothetical protein
MKQLLLFVFIVINLIAHSQENQTVTLLVSGQGKTQDEAKQNALRSAIEQAFGTFISSKTEILNDNLVKDEIVSVANGNIHKYEIISEVQIPNGDYATSLKATVSVSKLTSFAESKGVVVEFAGNILAANVKQQMLNEQNEIISINNIVNICKDILDKSFDYQIIRGEPKQLENNNEKWFVPINVNVTLNKNIRLFREYLYKSIKELAMSENEIEQYINLGKKTYQIAFGGNETAGIFIVPGWGRDPKNPELYKVINYLKSAYGSVKGLRFNVRRGEQKDIIGQGINLSEIEKLIKKDSKALNYQIPYEISFWDETEKSPLLHFRTLSSVVAFIDLINYLKHSILNFQITNGIKVITPEFLIANNELSKRNVKEKYDFRIIKDNLTPILNSPCEPRRKFGSFSKSLFISFCDSFTGGIKLFLEHAYEKNKEYDFKYHFGGKIHINDFDKGAYEKFSFLYRPEIYFSNNPSIYAVISYYDFLNYSNVQLSFTFNDILSLSEIEKVKEYKISAITK